MMFSFFSYGGKEPSSPKYHEQLLCLTKQLELKLYQLAPSFEAYLDMFTTSRLKQLAIRVVTETWPSCAQLVKAALQSRERNELHRKFEHKVAALQKEMDRVINEKTQVYTQLKEALVELKAKESLLGDKEEALEQLRLLQQQRDAEIKSLKLQVLTMRAENTTLASEKANAVDEATRTTLESKSLLEDVQALNSKHDKLKVVTQSMEKDVIESFLKDRKIKALSKKLQVLTNEVDEAVTSKLDVVVQLEDATRALLAKDCAAREHQKSELSKRLVLLQQSIEKARAETAKEVSEKMLLIEQINTISTSNESLESERTYLQQQLASLLRIDRNEDIKQQRNVIELNERIKSLQQAHDTTLSSIRNGNEVALSEKRSLEQTILSLEQAHDDALSSLRHEYEVVLSEKRSLEQTILTARSMSNESRVSSRSSLTQKALLLFQAGVSILTKNTSTSGLNLDISETDTGTTISSRIDGTRSEQLPIAALSSIRGSMVNEVEYNVGAVMKQGRKRTHMNSFWDRSNKSNKNPRL